MNDCLCMRERKKEREGERKGEERAEMDRDSGALQPVSIPLTTDDLGS